VLQNGEPHKFRRKGTVWCDFCQLSESDAPVVFFGGKDYVPLFGKLTRSYGGQRIIFHISGAPPAAPGCLFQRYQNPTKNPRKWPYECAKDFLDGNVVLNCI
jgi:hypothetical protein